VSSDRKNRHSVYNSLVKLNRAIFDATRELERLHQELGVPVTT